MAGKSTTKPATSRADPGDEGTPPPRQRLPLNTAGDVRRELARLYREVRASRHKKDPLSVADASRMANVLQILGRLIEISDLEARVKRLEANGMLEESGRRPRTH